MNSKIFNSQCSSKKCCTFRMAQYNGHRKWSRLSNQCHCRCSNQRHCWCSLRQQSLAIYNCRLHHIAASVPILLYGRPTQIPCAGNNACLIGSVNILYFDKKNNNKISIIFGGAVSLVETYVSVCFLNFPKYIICCVQMCFI